MAKKFERHGIQRVHIVDLYGAREGRFTIANILSRIRTETQLDIQVGGGLKTVGDLNTVFDAGADKVILGTIAAASPDTVTEWLKTYGSHRFILGADARNGNIMVRGWTEDSGLNVHEFIRGYSQVGLKEVICTDISVDGTLAGPAMSLYQEINSKCPDIRLIASGGVRNMDDVLTLKSIGVPAVVVGKALYEGHISLSQIAETC